MKLKMEVYSPELELLGILETFSSILWDDWSFEAGSFSLESMLTPQTRSLLKANHIIWIEGDTAGIIEHIYAKAKPEGISLTIKGPLIKGLLANRSLWGLYNLSGEVPALMNELVTDCAISPSYLPQIRKINGLVLSGQVPSTGVNIVKQKTGGELIESLGELGQAYGIAFGVGFNASVPQMEFWTRKCVDRTVDQSIVEPVFYSTELDDVLESEYTYNSTGYKNALLILGEGEGVNRKKVELGSEFSGIYRRELVVDARDLQSDSDPDHPMTDAEYLEALRNRGLEKQGDHQLVQSFSATIARDPNYVLGKDFFLGDFITVVDQRLGVSIKAQVEGVERSFCDNKEDMVLTIGYSLLDLSDRLRKGGL